jgi:hypothetical protein
MTTTGWLPDDRLAWMLLSIWIAAVLVYGVWRSLGDAKPDAIRPAGPEVL